MYNETIIFIQSKQIIIIIIISTLSIYIVIYLFWFVSDICYCKIFDLFLTFFFSKETTMKIRLFQLFLCLPRHNFIYIQLLVLHFNCIFLILSKFVNKFMAKYTYLPTTYLYICILSSSYSKQFSSTLCVADPL